MSSIKTTQIDGDVSVGRNVAIGGGVIVQGRLHFKESVRIDGWLYAKNIQSANKGVFTSIEKLEETYPHPHDGWWAVVGTTIPGPIYVGDGGEWVATGGIGGGDGGDGDGGGTGDGGCLFEDLGDVLLLESLDDVTAVGYYVYERATRTGTLKGVLVVSDVGGNITQVRYEYDGTYVRSKENGSWGDWQSDFVRLLRQHIDGETVYWDDVKQVIRAKGGGAVSSTYKITVNINPGDASRGVVGAEGAIGVTVSDDKTTYVIEVERLGDVTVLIKAGSRYEVNRVNVDKVNQGAITSYTFDDVTEDHTMYVWFQTKSEANPVDFLERSDLEGTYYSTVQAALTAVKEDYPEKLTRDVTIRCVKENVVFARATGTWLGEIANWNRDSEYVLTFDGNNELTLDCVSLGGLRFDGVDNIRVKNINFISVSNYYGAGSPDELSAVNFTGDMERLARNLYIDGCTIDGAYPTNAAAKGRYGVITKKAENVYIQGNTMTNFGAVVLKMVDCALLSVIKNVITPVQTTGIIGHPALCTCSNGEVIIVEDNKVIGSGIDENNFIITNMKKIYFRRNEFNVGRGRLLSVSSKVKVEHLALENNLIASMGQYPIYGWQHEVIEWFNDIETFDLNGNTIYMNAPKDWIHYFIRAQNNRITHFNMHNNIISGVAAYTGGNGPIYPLALGTVDNISIGDNVWQLPMKTETQATFSIMSINGKSYSTLNQMIAAGLETDTSALLSITGDSLLNYQVGVAVKPYEITAGYDALYKANDEYTGLADVEYKAGALSGNSRGCYNLAGTVIDEEGDLTTGYEGENITESETFDSGKVYATMSDSTLLLRHNTLDRGRFIRVQMAGEGHEELALGRYVLLHPVAVVDGEDEYSKDNVYTINIG